MRGRWTLERLGAGGVDFIRSFEPTVVLDVGERSLLCFHGSPRSCEELLLPTTPDEEFEEKLGGADADVLTGGHIHLQWLRRVRGSSFFNPGSVGMANDLMRAAREQGFDDHAEYGVLTATDGRLAVDLRRVPYDVERLVHEIYASGLPYAEDAAEKWSARRG